MKRENWNLDTDLWDDLPDLDSGEYAGEYSLEDILSEFSGKRDRFAVGPEEMSGEELRAETEYDAEVQADTAGDEMQVPEPDTTRPAFDRFEEEEEKEFGEEAKPSEPEAEPEAASETDAEAEAEPAEAELPKKAAATETPAAERKPGWLRGRKGRKVVEEFPEQPEKENIPVTDDFDYSSLFHMFADPEETDPNPAQSQTERADSSASEPDTETEDPAVPGTAAQKPTAAKAEPLLAENPLDFRDILREFMLGDQHPIYADMPGIGKKAGEHAAPEDDLADLDAVLESMIQNKAAPTSGKPARKETPEESPAQIRETETVQPLPAETDAEKTEAGTEPAQAARPKRKLELRSLLKPRAGAEKTDRHAAAPTEETAPVPKTKREYIVEEDFPPERPEPSEPTEGEETSWGTLDLPQAAAPEQSPGETQLSAEEHESEEAAEAHSETEYEDDTQNGRLQKLLRGFGVRTDNGRKRALNEPKAYARYEDFVPEETEPEKAAGVPGDTEKPAGAADGTDEGTQAQPQPEEYDPAADDEILYAGDFPTFGQWILNELMTLWIRINGIGDRQSTATMEDESEDLGKEVNVANASRYYGSQVTMLRMRFQIGIVLIAILAYITLGFPVSGMLKTAKVAAAMCLGLQLTEMLLCLDIVTNAAVNLTRRKFGADALAVLACVISSLDALNVAVGGFGNPHIPLCLFSSLALMGCLLSSLLSARALRKSTRVPAIGKRVYCVTAEEGVRSSGDLTLLKSVRPSAGFVRRAEESPPDEALFARSAFLQLVAAILLSLLTALVKHSVGDLLYILSAILSCAVPVTALLAFALPFFIGSARIFSSGAAVAGWSGIHDIGCSRNLIVTDRDLFPEDTVAIETVRIFADDSAERVIGFAGSMIAASGSGLAPCFAELMEKNNCRMRMVEDFQWLSGGGLQGRIEGSTVLCGSSDLMQLMNVKVPYRLVDRTTVLLAIDGVLYGIFKINYTGLPEIRTALQELIASNRHPIFAIRDFNITPDMLHEVFDVATDGYDFPPYGDRFRISEAKPSETSKVSAVICREGLGPLTHLADTGRSMYVAIRLNLIVTAAVAVFGMLLVFFKLIGTGEVSAWLPFVLMLLDAIIVTLISLFMRF